MDSVVDDTKCCSLYLEDGKTTLASTWCADCQTCFCDECLKLHNKIPTTRTHDVSKLTGNKQQKLKQPFICKKHEEKMKLFCKDCKKPVCTVCCSLSRRKCEEVVEIIDMLPEVKGQLMKRQEKLVEIAEGNKADIVDYGDKLDKFLMKSVSVKSEITKTIQCAVDHLREKETELLDKLDVQTDQQTEKLRSKMKTKQTETQMYQQQSQFIQQALELEDEAQLFDMYLSPESGAVADIKETRREEKIGVADIILIHDRDKLKDVVGKMDVKGADNTLELTATPMLHEFIAAKLDEYECDVRDAVVMNISDVKVTVFVDYGTDQLKSVYHRGRRTCSSVLKMPHYPWCLTVISEAKVAVSLHNRNNIITVAVTPDLKLLSTIKTSKAYFGISTLDQSTLVACSSHPSSVDLIDLKGNILKTFTTLPSIGKSFSHPRYIHVTRQGNILVSDVGLKSVICLTRFGDILFSYTPTGDRALAAPFGITSTITGDIIVADYKAHIVIHLRESGKFISDILTAEDGLKNPFGLCVDEDNLCVTVAAKGLRKYKFVTK